MKKLHDYLMKLSLYRSSIKLAEKVVLPGFNGLPLFDVIVFFNKKIQTSDLTMRASALSFSFFLALFPGVIFLFTLIPYIEIQGIDFQYELFALLNLFLPESTFETTSETLNDIINQPRGGLMSFGFVMALFLSTNGINAMIDSFNKSYHTKETRNYLRQRLVALGLNMVLVLLLFACIILIVVGQVLLNEFGDYIFQYDIITYYVVIFSRWVIIIALLLFSISILFYYGPAVKKKWRFISVGATMSTILSIITSIA
ncbi:MAG: YihY/virulence factor BrkB family protein, partial [Bacteroidia bacterium]|nr:YihY/virulence factor BrkB family protein [Bacteroidia bacterium]